MFFEGFVEGADGKVYFVNNDFNDGSLRGKAKGLYEVIPTDTVPYYSARISACVKYVLLLEDDNLGQIVNAGNWGNIAPIALIGVKEGGGDVYGFYQDNTDGEWKKKDAAYGHAKDG